MKRRLEVADSQLGRQLPTAARLVAAGGGVGADSIIGDVAFAAFDTVVDADLADGAEGFVVESRDAESSEEIFVELAQIGEVQREGWDFNAFVGEKEFLVAGIPKTSELAFEHDGRDDGHLKAPIGALAELGAATVFFDADYAAGAADGKSEGGERLNLLWSKALFDIPHDGDRVRLPADCVKSPAKFQLGGREFAGERASCYRCASEH